MHLLHICVAYIFYCIFYTHVLHTCIHAVSTITFFAHILLAHCADRYCLAEGIDTGLAAPPSAFELPEEELALIKSVFDREDLSKVSLSVCVCARARVSVRLCLCLSVCLVCRFV